MLIKKRCCKCLSVFLLLLVVISTWLIVAESVHADESEHSVVTLETDPFAGKDFFAGQKLDVPEATLLCGGESYVSNSALVLFPSGKASYRSEITLEESGAYTVEYAADRNGHTIRARTGFTVQSETFSVGDAKSAAFYGRNEVYAPDKEGIVLSIVRGDRFTYNRTIDLSGKTKEDLTLRFFATPQQEGQADILDFVITFTDIYDSSNFVEIHVKTLSHLGRWADAQAYVTAGANGQVQMGLENGLAHKGNDYGYPAYFSMVGRPYQGGSVGEDTFDLSFDYAERKVFVADSCYGGDTMVADLDDPAYYTDLWAGFTTGECYVSISGENYQSSSMNLVITEIDGYDLEQANFIDSDAPDITIDWQGYDANTLPVAKTGVFYRLFDADAYDTFDGEAEVIGEVFYNYRASSRTQVQVANGGFVPTRPGIYSIVYTAQDRFGNKTVQVIDVLAEAGEPDLTVTVAGETKEATLGTSVKVFQNIEWEGQSGFVKLDISATHQESGEIYTVDSGSNEFFPLEEGFYEVSISVSDYITEWKDSFEIEVKGGVPAIPYEANLPKYFLKNAAYELPELMALDFSDGTAQQVPAQLSILEDGVAKDNFLNADGKYVVSAQENVTIRYSLTVGGETAEKEYIVPVVDVGYGGQLMLENYFQIKSGKLDILKNSEDIEFVTAENSSVEFVREVQTENFSLTFNTVKGKTAMAGVNVYLTDSKDGTTVKIGVYRTAGGSLLRLNGEMNYPLPIVFDDPDGEFFRIAYTNEDRRITCSGQNVQIQQDIEGKPFVGFASGKAYLRFEFVDVTDEVALKLMSINNQIFFDTSRDNFAPQILANAVRGDRLCGEELVILPASACDVLDPDVEFRLKVTAPDGNPAKSTDGVTLDESCSPTREYRISLSQYGEYLIEYIAIDGGGKQSTYSYGVSVVDAESPTITLGESQKTAKIGETVKIAEAVVTDNISENLEATVYLELPSGILVKMSQNSFKAVEAGKYKVMFSVYDESGNYATASYSIMVA